MEQLLRALPWLMGGFLLLAALCALRGPLKWLLALAARTGLGFVLLYALGQVGGLGLHLGANLGNALVLGTLGLPGFGLLAMVSWALRLG